MKQAENKQVSLIAHVCIFKFNNSDFPEKVRYKTFKKTIVFFKIILGPAIVLQNTNVVAFVTIED